MMKTFISKISLIVGVMVVCMGLQGCGFAAQTALFLGWVSLTSSSDSVHTTKHIERCQFLGKQLLKATGDQATAQVTFADAVRLSGIENAGNEKGVLDGVKIVATNARTALAVECQDTPLDSTTEAIYTPDLPDAGDEKNNNPPMAPAAISPSDDASPSGN